MNFSFAEKIDSMGGLFQKPWDRLKRSKMIKRFSIFKVEGKLQGYQISVVDDRCRSGEDPGLPQHAAEVKPTEVVEIDVAIDDKEKHDAQEETADAAVSARQEPVEDRIDTEELLYNFGVYGRQLQDAQHQLDIREEYFQQDREERERRIAIDFPIETRTDFDVKQLQESQRMTTFLIQAEQEYNTAKAALLAAGIQPPGSSIESGFVDDVNDGYRISEERDLAEYVDVERVQSWLTGLPDVEIPSGAFAEETAAQSRDGDSWQFKEVELWESRSMVAEGAARRRIDKWRAQAESCAPAIQGNEVGEV